MRYCSAKLWSFLLQHKQNWLGAFNTINNKQFTGSNNFTGMDVDNWHVKPYKGKKVLIPWDSMPTSMPIKEGTSEKEDRIDIQQIWNMATLEKPMPLN